MADSKKYDGSQWEHSLRKLTTATEAVENPLYSDGIAITAYTIKGNTVQNGTPTPSNPVDVNGVGVRTENLFDISLLEQGGWFATAGTVPTKMTPETTSYATRTRYKQIVPLLASTLSLYCPDNVKINYVWIDANGISLGESGWQKNGDITTAPEQAVYMTFILGLDGDIECTLNDFYDINLVAGSIAPESYEPYGIKIPILSGGVTTNIYLGSTQTTRRIKKIVFNGTEDIWVKSTANIGSFYSTAWIMLPLKGIGLCTHLPFVSSISYTQGSFTIAGSNSLNVWFPQFDASTTIQDLKSYLAQQYAAGTPVTIWCVPATPETAVVNEPLMKIGDYADTLSNAASIPITEGANSITVDTTVQPSEFTATWTGWHDSSVKKWDGSNWD